MTLHIKDVVAQQIFEAQAKWSANLETQTECMLKSGVAASAARTDTTANALMDCMDLISEMVFQLAQREYNPSTVERNVVNKASEEAISASFLKQPVPPASSPIAALPANKTVVSQSFTSANVSQNVDTSTSSQDAALILEQRSTMSDANSRKINAEETADDSTPSSPVTPPDPQRRTQ